MGFTSRIIADLCSAYEARLAAEVRHRDRLRAKIADEIADLLEELHRADTEVCRRSGMGAGPEQAGIPWARWARILESARELRRLACEQPREPRETPPVSD